ncbi:DUF6760 family protein [Actinokineospora auranticolor]|uniref:DUF6760 family protein n=1 Tax=Actinokineospora auranticolor TaxID=155976 RepID=UPI000CEBB5E4
MRPGLRGGHRGRCGRWCPGGILTYAADRLWEEVAYVAYYLHWAFESILDLEHPVRTRLITEIGRIHSRQLE